MKTVNNNILGVAFLVLSVLIFSLQDIAVKWIGGDYPVMEIVIFRTIGSLPFTLLFFRYEGGRGLPTTQQHKLQYIRGVFLFLSFTTYFMGLTALPLGEVASIRNSAPLMITFLSVILLGEKVGPRRWLALIVGFVGVLLIVRPGSVSFNIGSVFILLATLFYTFGIMLTRKLQSTDSSATMAYFSTFVYLVATAILVPLTIFVGEIPGAHPSIAFLFRAWTMPTLIDLGIMSGMGLVWAGGMYFMARAYSLALASIAAPFEYSGLPISVMWGFVLWHEIPSATTWIGALLTITSGVYILYRDQKDRSESTAGITEEEINIGVAE